MARVRDILEAKGNEVHVLGPGAMVLDALELMAKHNIGSLPVVEDDQLRGIFTERLYARNVFLKGRSSPKTPIADVMARDVVTVTPDETAEACVSLMSAHGIRHLPVLEDERLTGIISIGDLMKSIIRDREFDIDQLVEYVHR